MANSSRNHEIYPGVVEYKVIPQNPQNRQRVVNGYFNGHTMIAFKYPNTIIESEPTPAGYLFDAERQVLTLLAGYSLVPAYN